MSDLIAEARVLIRPDTTRFRQELQEQVRRATSQTQIPAVTVPIAASASGLGAASAASAALAAQQQATTQTTLGLASAAQLENTAFGRQAVILEATAVATQQKAGADVAATAAARAHAAQMGQVERAAVASTAGMLGLRGAVLTAGTAFIAATVGFQAFGRAVGSAIEFEKQLNVFQATAGATAAELERVSATARELGRDITLPGVSAGDAAAALTELSKAGLDVQESLAAARGTLQLATAAQIENARAAELVAGALNSFRLGGEEATRVADLLAGAANASQGSVEEMGIALRQVAGAASQIGISVDETVTLLTALARAGLAGSDAGTTLRVALLRLVAPTKAARDELERFGIQLRDQLTGNVRVDALFELEDALDRVSKAEADAARVAIFGQNAFRISGLIGRLTASDFRVLEESVSAAGNAQELAAAQTQGLGGDIEAAKNQFSDLGITVGNIASGPLSLFVRTAGATAGAVNEMTREVEESAGGGGAFASLGEVLDGLQDTFSEINISFQTGVRRSLDAASGFTVLAAAARSTDEAVTGLAEALERAAAATLQQQGLPEQGLNPQQVLNRLAGFDEQQTLAKIRGDTQGLLDSLAAEQAFLQQQLSRQFVQNRDPLRRQLQDALLGATNEIASLNKQAANTKKQAAADIQSAQREADQALLQQLSLSRQRQENIVASAAQTQTVSDDIKAQLALRTLIQRQIAIIRAQVGDEQAKRAAIVALTAAKIQTNAAIKALRAQQEQERQDTLEQIQNLNIQIAQERGDDALLEKRIRQRLNTINKAIRGGKEEGVALKQLILERERLRNQLKELGEKDDEDQKDARKAAAQFLFEQFQAQQGFASNLLGNLITGPTAGLVGVPSPVDQTIPDVSGLIGGARAAAIGRQGGTPTAAQSNTVIALLGNILSTLKEANRADASPEAKQQRRDGSAVGDGVGGGGGQSAVM